MQIALSKRGAMLYLRASEGRVARTIEYRPDVYLDLDQNGRLLGVEVVNADSFVHDLEDGIQFPDYVDAGISESADAPVDMTAQITLAEAAEIADRSVVTLRQAAQRGALKAERLGPERRGIWHTTRADLEDYLDNRPERFQLSKPPFAAGPAATRKKRQLPNRR